MKRKRENERAIVTIDRNVQCRPEKYKDVVESKICRKLFFCVHWQFGLIDIRWQTVIYESFVTSLK